MTDRIWMIYIGIVSIIEGLAMIVSFGRKPRGWRTTASLQFAKSKMKAKP